MLSSLSMGGSGDVINGVNKPNNINDTLNSTSPIRWPTTATENGTVDFSGAGGVTTTDTAGGTLPSFSSYLHLTQPDMIATLPPPTQAPAANKQLSHPLKT